MGKFDIINAINLRVGSNYRLWTIGITNNESVRRQQHQSQGENVSCWTAWWADSEQIARDIEALFLARGCKGGTGGGNPSDPPRYVYVY